MDLELDNLSSQKDDGSVAPTHNLIILIGMDSKTYHNGVRFFAGVFQFSYTQVFFQSAIGEQYKCGCYGECVGCKPNYFKKQCSLSSLVQGIS